MAKVTVEKICPVTNFLHVHHQVGVRFSPHSPPLFLYIPGRFLQGMDCRILKQEIPAPIELLLTRFALSPTTAVVACFCFLNGLVVFFLFFFT